MAEQFDLFSIINIGCLDVSADSIVQGTLDSSHLGAEEFVPSEDELFVTLKHASFIVIEPYFLVLKPDIILIGSLESGNGKGHFGQVAGRVAAGGSMVEQFKDLTGNEGGSAFGDFAAGGVGDFGGIEGGTFHAGDTFPFFKPFLIAGSAPSEEVLFIDGRGMEVGGKDFLYEREAVEPEENGGDGVSIEETLVELLTDFMGQAGNFAGGIAGGRAFRIAAFIGAII
jgi:hypothetical protein